MTLVQWIALVWAWIGIGAGTPAIPAQAASNPAAPFAHVVVAELFTSEGCSSCPPADAALPQLVEWAHGTGIEVVALEEHVDYWDHLGWKDPFSSAVFSQRQSDYNRVAFGSGQLYTPQLVVDGSHECVGSDRAAAMAAIARAAKASDADLQIEQLRVAKGLVHAMVSVDAARLNLRGPADLVLAVAEDGLMSRVGAGENSGRRLLHTGVVRTLTRVATIRPGAAPGRIAVSVPTAGVSRMDKARLVALLQDGKSRRILGAAALRVEPDSQTAESGR